MIVFDLQCRAGGEQFEAWFRSNADFERQQANGLVQCPVCRSAEVVKAPMAPRVPRKSGASAGEMIAELAQLQRKLLSDSTWVGDRFADTARAMHLGEVESVPVHGEATAAQARALIDEGVSVAPLPLPVVPPNQVN